MSFLDESSATLQEALAFIDACEAPSTTSSAHTQTRAARKTDYWQRVRAEGERLRLETTALEATLLHLQAERLARVNRRPTHLEREYARCRLTETTNQRLRALLSMNHMMLSALARIANAASEDTPVALSAMVDRLNRLETNSMAILDRTGLLNMESFLLRKQHERDSALGSVIESVSSVPLLIDQQQTDLVLWSRIMQDLDVTQSDARSCSKALSAVFAYKDQQIQVTTSMTSRRHVQGESVLYVWTAVTPISSKNVDLIEEGLIRVRNLKPCNANAPHKRSAIMQHWYRIHMDEGHRSRPSSSADGASVELEYMKESCLRWCSNISTSYLQSLETMLMGQTESSDIMSSAAS